MSGICGYVDYVNNNNSNEIVSNMCSAISHRGKETRFFSVENSRIGFIDSKLNTKRNNNPYLSNDNGLFVFFDGEIYNLDEIEEVLKKYNITCNKNSVCEIIGLSYIKWGVESFSRFNGMFSIFIYDIKKQETYLVRDRYGIKPVYYSMINNCFVFGSEQKAIYAFPKFNHDIDYEALVEYFTFQNIITNRTLEKSIKIVEPGTYIKYSKNNIEIKKYWEISFSEEKNFECDEKIIEEKLDYLLENAVKKQIEKNEEIGCFLSGGMDSSTVTYIANKLCGRVKTFTCGYNMNDVSLNEIEFDERYRTELIANKFGTEHFERILQPIDIENSIADVCFHNEEPRVGQTYTNYHISKLASRFVNICFSGTGGDEFFGGYPWRYIRTLGSKNFDDFIENYYSFWQRLIPSNKLESAFEPIKNKISGYNPKEIFINDFQSIRHENNSESDYVNYCLYFEAKHFLSGCLMVEDKIGMKYGLESRFPLLDNDLTNYALKMPVKYKLRDFENIVNRKRNERFTKNANFYERTSEGKYILRKTMKKYLPDEIYTGVKQGFSAPDASWFKKDSKYLIDNLLNNNNALIWNILNLSEIKNLVNDHFNDKANRRLLIWSLLNFNQLLEYWFK